MKSSTGRKRFGNVPTLLRPLRARGMVTIRSSLTWPYLDPPFDIVLSAQAHIDSLHTATVLRGCDRAQSERRAKRVQLTRPKRQKRGARTPALCSASVGKAVKEPQWLTEKPHPLRRSAGPIHRFCCTTLRL